MSETIAAIATATAPAGVGVIRISGDRAFDIAQKVLRVTTPLIQQASATLRRMDVIDFESHESIDDGLVAVFRSPNSFTGEDVVELQGHGGSITLSRVLAAVLAAGARNARPGEFSERAFVNGKLDLAQAEAIAMMISAQTVAAQRVARNQLQGTLSRSVRSAQIAIEDALARIEASIDFPEDVGELATDDVATEIVVQSLTTADSIVSELLATADYGRRLTDGVTLVLAGQPNVGKSSLLNALAGYDRAIVSPIAGTTRDIVEETLNIGGIPVRALDTAGIRETVDPIERIGVERAQNAVADADVVIIVIDATSGMTGDDEAFLRKMTDRTAIVAVNKTDLTDPGALVETIQSCFPNLLIIPLVAKSGLGIDRLMEALTALLGQDSSVDSNLPMVTSTRHKDALLRAHASLSTAITTVSNRLPAELIAVDAHAAISTLGEITGQSAREEIIAGIFSRFCIGK